MSCAKWLQCFTCVVLSLIVSRISMELKRLSVYSTKQLNKLETTQVKRPLERRIVYTSSTTPMDQVSQELLQTKKNRCQDREAIKSSLVSQEQTFTFSHKAGSDTATHIPLHYDACEPLCHDTPQIYSCLLRDKSYVMEQAGLWETQSITECCDQTPVKPAD